MSIVIYAGHYACCVFPESMLTPPPQFFMALQELSWIWILEAHIIIYYSFSTPDDNMMVAHDLMGYSAFFVLFQENF